MQIEIVKEINHIPVSTILDVKERDGLFYVQHKTRAYTANWIRFVVEQGIAKPIKEKRKCTT